MQIVCDVQPSSPRGREPVTPPHRHSLSLFAQTMVYTIHEIPIFIAMGVVGKGHPTQDTAPRPETLAGTSQWEQSMWWCRGLWDSRPCLALKWLERAAAPIPCLLPWGSKPLGREPTPQGDPSSLLLHWETPLSRLGPGQQPLLCENLFPERKAKPFRNKPDPPSGCGDGEQGFSQTVFFCPLLYPPVPSAAWAASTIFPCPSHAAPFWSQVVFLGLCSMP